ncbi:trypsin-like cysteine/serine peptidase domain-containing protein [Hypoxylon trugodes]|uniref:trypsin-like cysteine/serine peptidase domain-containing protein n=1 Tax=Hypoxylon trugodes TaxID=326681 RepID=UPI002198896B|nr:trypsin-like cysteine/serine peptidase domain-containing protein [Hypoxylon trugodes]KAI1384094.1 trypsin-like cysteine/serine peptidase domain-containing protein [Hypoxylon trugodes]
MRALGGTFSGWGKANYDDWEKTAVRLDFTFEEAYLGKNPLMLVDVQEIQPGKMPQAIVYIVVALDNGGFRYGSGTVIDNNIVVTAGHVLISSSGRAVSVDVIAGEGDTKELRRGKCAAIHGRWYSMQAIANDVGVIELNEPFKNVQPLTYIQSPIANDTGGIATVYGFPKDESRFLQNERLHKSRAPCKYNPTFKMIQHEGDSIGGVSGGPMIDKLDKVIAIHHGWNNDKETREVVNLAVTIGHNGNDFAALRQVLGASSIPGSTSHTQDQSHTVECMGMVTEINGVIYKW